MPITAFTGLTPPSTDDPTNFDSRADAFLGAFPTFQEQVNDLEADLNNLVSAVFTTASATSLTIGTGSKSFTVQTGLGFIAGQTAILASTADATKLMTGQVTSYNSATGAMVVNVISTAGSGTFADWTVGLGPAGSVSAYMVGVLSATTATAARTALGMTDGQLPATATNDSAGAGCVGELIKSVGATLGATSGTAQNITSISLTSGDWDVSGNIGITGGSGTTVSQLFGSVSSTSSTLQGNNLGSFSTSNALNLTAQQTAQFATGIRPFSLAATTTIYLVGEVISSGGTATFTGSIMARRVR